MIYIIRHGQTKMNQMKTLQGRSDHPLNETGIRQGEEAGRWFKEHGITFSHVYSSPLIRAMQTARLVIGDPDMEIRTDKRLLEIDCGPYEGISLENPAPEIVTFFSDFIHNPAPEGMEQLSSVVKRLGEFLEDIKDLQGNILISTHAIAMKGALEYLTPDSHGSYWSTYLSNCAVYMAENKNGHIGIPEEVDMTK